MADKSHHTVDALQSSIHRRTRYLMGLHKSLLKHRPDTHFKLVAGAIREAHVPNFRRLMSNGASRTSAGLRSELSKKRSRRMAHGMRKVIGREGDNQGNHESDTSLSSGDSDSSNGVRARRHASLVSEAFAAKLASQIEAEDDAAPSGTPPAEYIGWVLVKVKDKDKTGNELPGAIRASRYVILPSFKPIIIRKGEKTNPRSIAKLVFSRYKSQAYADSSKSRSHLVVGVALLNTTMSYAMSYIVKDQKSTNGFGKTRPKVGKLAKRLTKTTLEDALMHTWTEGEDDREQEDEDSSD